MSAHLRASASRVRDALRLLVRVLRELADENAYVRHLSAHGCEHSGDEWRRFCDAHLRAKYQRARCC
jgi:hypothetical protein